MNKISYIFGKNIMQLYNKKKVLKLMKTFRSLVVSINILIFIAYIFIKQQINPFYVTLSLAIIFLCVYLVGDNIKSLTMEIEEEKCRNLIDDYDIMEKGIVKIIEVENGDFKIRREFFCRQKDKGICIVKNNWESYNRQLFIYNTYYDENYAKEYLLTCSANGINAYDCYMAMMHGSCIQEPRI